MSLYLGNNLISGVASPVEPTRNIGQIIQSTIPLTDAGLHLLDGALIQGSGSYSAFVDYIAELYNDAKVYNPSAFTVVGSPTITADGIASGFSDNDYIQVSSGQNINLTKPFKIDFSFTPTAQNMEQYILRTSVSYLWIYITSGNNLSVRLGTSAWGSDIISANYNNISINTNYKLSIEFTGTGYKVSLNDNVFYTRATTSVIPVTDTGFVFAKQSGNNYLRGSIDLKQFSITVDGKEVFSGSKPAKYFTDETTWQTSVTTYGSCGKFVYDSVNNTVRLPKITGFIEGTTDVTALGDLIEAGLPNITGSVGVLAYYSQDHQSGAFYKKNQNGTNGTLNANNLNGDYGFDASRSNSVYGNSSTVQPQAIKVLYYIVIANSTKTDIQVDIDEIATDLNGKADVDLTNVNNSGTSRGAGWAMPSNTYIDLTAGASGAVYTAPSNGYFVAKGTTNTENNINHPIYWILMQDNGVTEITWTDFSTYWTGNCTISVITPARKNGKYKLAYGRMASVSVGFIYAQGSESEAQ